MVQKRGLWSTVNETLRFAKCKSCKGIFQGDPMGFSSLIRGSCCRIIPLGKLASLTYRNNEVISTAFSF